MMNRRTAFPRHIAVAALAAGLLALASLSGARGSQAWPEKSGIDADILIAGGGTGAVAAALRACALAEEAGITRIIMTEETDWIGGQYTSQGVSSTDPNVWTQMGQYEVGASHLYHDFHERIRDLYRPRALEVVAQTSRAGGPDSRASRQAVEHINSTLFTPGNSWGNRLAFPPEDGVTVFTEMLRPHIDSGLLSIYTETIPVSVESENGRISSVTFQGTSTERTFTVRPRFVIDATELGDLFPLAGMNYQVGIEPSHETGEPSLFNEDGSPRYPEAVADCIQSFTYTFALEWGEPGSDHREPWENRPASYEANRRMFTISYFQMEYTNEFATEKRFREAGIPDRIHPWWTYRRLIDAAWFDPDLPMVQHPRFVDGEWVTSFSPEETPEHYIPNDFVTNVGDIITVNFSSNDYAGRNLIDVTAEERALAIEEAKELSLGYLYWLWYEAPRDPMHPGIDPSVEHHRSIDPATGKSTGYANLIFRRDIMGTEDGFSKFPYIRESRRIDPLFQIRQQHIMGDPQHRAESFIDSVGVGSYYYMDIHGCDKGTGQQIDVVWKDLELEDGRIVRENSLRPFQIPFGSLIPKDMDGFLAGAKNLGVTHVTNGSYRLQPVEFQIGESAGMAAALSLKWGVEPRDFRTDEFNPADPSANEILLRNYQVKLLRSRVPLVWLADAGWDHEDFEAIHMAKLLDLMEADGWLFHPGLAFTAGDARLALGRLSGGDVAFMANEDADAPADPALLLEVLTTLFPEAPHGGAPEAGATELSRSKAARMLHAFLSHAYQLS